MKKSTQETVSQLKQSATSKEDFMRQLAQLETGEIAEETLAKIDGGKVPSVGESPIILPVLGIYLPPPTDF